MGGMKASGVGRRHGAEGILKYTETQTVATQHLVPIGGLPGVSHDTWVKILTRAIRLLNLFR